MMTKDLTFFEDYFEYQTLILPPILRTPSVSYTAPLAPPGSLACLVH